MYRNLHQLYAGEIALISDQPILAELFQELESAIERITRTAVAISRPTQEATAKKRLAKAELFEKGHLVYSLMYAAAIALERVELIEVVKKNTINGKGRADEDLIRKATVLAEEALLLEDKAKYMLSEESIAELQTAIANFTLLVGEPRKTIISRKMLGQSLHLLFKRTDRMLKEKLDKLMLFATKDNPELLEKYKSSRMVVDITATRKTNSDEASLGAGLDNEKTVEDKRLDEEAPPKSQDDSEENPPLD